MVAEATGERLEMKQMPAELEAEQQRRSAAQDLADAVLTLLAARGVPVSTDVESEIRSASDPDLVSTWLLRAATASSATDVIGDE
jgi:hypothetical protein